MEQIRVILDYSQHVEVVAREADATAYPYYPSEFDIKRTSPRHLGRIQELSRSVPLSLSGLVPRILDDDEMQRIFEERLKLFDSIESLRPETSEGRSKQRTLVEWFGTLCYVCGSATTVMRDERAESRIPHIRVRSCPECGWWVSENTALIEVTGKRSYDSYTLLRRACLREFAIIDEEAPVEALRLHLSRHPEELNRISPKKLESLVGSVFADYLSCEAVHVGGPGDGGYDLILLAGDTPLLVQVKQRLDPQKAEPVSLIREFIGALVLAEAKSGVFVTSAARFSRASQEAARRVPGTVIERLELVDASKLLDILKLSAGSVDPWRLYAHSLADGEQVLTKPNDPKLFTI